MIIYIAGAYIDRSRLCGIRDTLQQQGIQVTSRWLDTPAHVGYMAEGSDKPLHVHAVEDLDDIRASDALVIESEGGLGRGGRHVEFGYALALGKPLVVIGEPSNPFQALPSVIACPAWSVLPRLLHLLLEQP